MAANTQSIFYQIGTLIKAKLAGLLDRYTATSDLQNSVTLGTVAESSSVFGGSTLRVAGIDTAATYTTIEFVANGAAPAPVAVTFGAGAAVITVDTTATVNDVIAFVNDPLNGVSGSLSASLSVGDGSHLVTALAAAPFTAGTDVSVRNNISIADNATVGGTLSVTGNATVSGNHTVTGDLTVNGTTTTLATTNSSIQDNVIQLSDGAGTNYANDAGFYFNRGATFDDQVVIWDASASQFTMGSPDAAEDASSATFTVAPGDLKLNTVLVYDDSTTSYKEIGDIEDFSTALNS